MVKMLEKINRFIDRVEDFFLTYLVIVMTLAIFLQVIMRYVFNNSLSWSEEFATFCFMWLTWIGASNAVKRNSHIRILVLVDKLKDASRNIVMLAIDIIWLLFSLFLVKNGIQMVMISYTNNRVSAALDVPMCFMYASVVTGGALMCVGLASVIAARWANVISDRR